MNFKPMLAASLDGVDLESLRYPLLGSPKLDGVRCIVWEGVAYSRNAKPIRNQFVQAWAKDFSNLDGELIVGDPTDGLCLNTTQSGVMSIAGAPDFYFHAFDMPERNYTGFYDNYEWMITELDATRLMVVPHILIKDHEALLAAEQKFLLARYEGMMLRSLNGPYKNGRSTLREGYLMKLKRFTDGEGQVIALEEALENQNVLQRDELGRAKRTSHQENMVGKGMVGVIVVQDRATSQTMRLSPGIMTHAEREYFWKEQWRLIGSTVHWRAFGYGQKDTPRFPRFYGIREDL
jgi:ATP-dependent DNA ligase